MGGALALDAAWLFAAFLIILILAAQAQLGVDVDAAEARRELDVALSDAPAGPEEPSEAKYARARLRAAGDQA